MRERLEKFIRTEGLTPSRFAEIMGVQPSSISHILGGRNKPSFDFIEKMLLRFPKVNPDWLLLGKGPIYRSTENSLPEKSTPPSIPITQTPTSTGTLPTLPFETPVLPKTSAPETAEQSPISTPSQANSVSSNSETLKNGAEPTRKSRLDISQIPEETIEQIVIFLKDKTFISYRPK